MQSLSTIPHTTTRHRLRRILLALWDAISLFEPPKRPADEPEEILPFLPNPRPRCITPQPSAEPPRQEACLFFSRLPPEIRIHIYSLAFGNRTLHMDLRYYWPDAPRSRLVEEDGSTRHYAIRTMEDYDDRPEIDGRQPKAWRWWSCVCHREPPPHLVSAIRSWDKEPGPWWDRCRNGNRTYCSLWGGNWPERCYVGVMGWLLSCRQAYSEVIDIVYSQNTFHISSHAIFGNLDQMLLPQRLSCISALEICLETRMSRPDRWSSYIEGINAILSVFQALTAHLPGLVALHLAIISVFEVDGTLNYHPILDVADQFIADKPSLKRFTLSLPRSIF